MKLWAPASYWTTPKDELDKITGGCGPGRFGDWLVPDSLLGLCITPACKIHDFCYHIGETIQDKEQADRAFLNNMVRIIQETPALSIVKKVRLKLARIYYKAVVDLGGDAFWKEKNPPEEFQEEPWIKLPTHSNMYR